MEKPPIQDPQLPPDLPESHQWLQTVLRSIGDAVIATSAEKDSPGVFK